MSDHAPSLRLSWSGLTHPGKVRPNNEDAFLALTFDGHGIHYLGKTGEAELAGSDFLFAVSDGMGGARSGEFASRIAVERITRLMPRAFRLRASGMNAGFQDLLFQLLGEIHQDLTLLGRSYEECAGMGATLSLVWLAPGVLFFAHVGDSRIYYLPGGGEMKQVSHDHTYVGFLRRSGQIGEREARSHPRRNALNMALGAGQQLLEPQIGAIDLRPGDRFLLCTDGLVDGLWDRQLEEALRHAPTVEGLAPRLVEDAVAASGKDNVTTLVVDVKGSRVDT